jgi:hypothetical protein
MNVALALVVLAVTSCSSSQPAVLTGYAGSPSMSKISVGVVVGEGEQVSDSRVVTEDSHTVVVEVDVSTIGSGSPTIAERHLVELMLGTPLGNRRVFDGNGRELPTMCCV